jgi:hypothetical protein
LNESMFSSFTSPARKELWPEYTRHSLAGQADFFRKARP